MSITNTNTVAKVAAVIAGLGLVAMSFASFAPAAKAATTADLNAQLQALLAQVASLQAQLGSSQGASVTFSRDLTVGATGADVTALQTWLIGKGFSIPAGATGYFGAQTKAAVAAFQAANGITPAAGYFGPITRAKVNAMAGGSTTTTTTTTTGGVTLSGGEADLTNYNLVSEQGSFSEGDTNVKVATAEFDVSGGDVSVQRADLEFQAAHSSATADVKPWKYVDSISLWDGSKKLATVDASSQSAWDDSDTDTSINSSGAKRYKVSLTGISDVVKEGNTAHLTFSVNANSSIDAANTDQSFDIRVPDNGIRAIDAAGIQQYTGDNSDTVGVDLNSAQNGNLTVKEDSSDPEAGTLVADDTNTSDDLTVFAFDIKNSDDKDTKVTDLTFNVATGAPAVSTGATDLTDLVRKATLTFGGKSYDGDVNTNNTISFNDMEAIVGSNSTEKGILKVSLYGQSSHFAPSGESVLVSLSHSNVTAEGADSGDSVASSDISGTATGNTQSITVNGGITVAGNSMAAVQTYNSNAPQSSYGTFTLKFDVTAVGDDVYVPKGIDTSYNGGTATSTSGHTASTTDVGVGVNPAMSASTTDSVVTTSLTTTADSDNSLFYVVHEGDTETFTATVTINPLGLASALTNFQVGLDVVKFSATDTDFHALQSLNVDETNSDFHTDPLTIAG